jgi:(2Fe-2S) ferredoxin
MPDSQPQSQSAGAERRIVFVCQGPSCGERGGQQLLEQLKARLAGRSDGAVRACGSTCLDSCPTGPNVMVAGARAVRTGVQGEQLEHLLEDLGQPAVRTSDAASVEVAAERDRHATPSPDSLLKALERGLRGVGRATAASRRATAEARKRGGLDPLDGRQDPSAARDAEGGGPIIGPDGTTRFETGGGEIRGVRR